LNEYLVQTRYEAHRTIQNSAYFEELLSRSISEETEREGTRFLEIGCGNRLMTATYAKNERSVRSICAIDISMEAVSATFRNSATQRRFPGGVGDHE
jgi:methylase of polypeptide subunit release factors